ncbi:VRR-NUC domain-containing protein [Ferrimonas sp. YFM]|uniref:VRR-NUC domain-containing protein n=1 Tax=Ferrimonas sp. YFM TaxID=3028878 RepID=UPI002573F8E4|nr:VRR-NUC domain-containing protein [Ferrimonas sp. YFM]BDY05288.1 nuclease [Ferrimonas sp. YFM]
METLVTSEGAELASDYYLTNFQTLTEEVRRRSAHLLSPEETRWLRRFDGLERTQQCLLVRLLSRKGPLFRLDKLSYAEIPDLAGCAQALVETELAAWHPISNWTELGGLCTKAELLAMAPDANPKLRKPELLDSLKSQPLPSHRLQVLNLKGSSILDTLRLLYFGNLHQDLAQFVVTDLGIQRFESYPITADGLAIDSREALETWLSLGELAKACHLCLERRNPDGLLELAPRLPDPLPWPEIERKRQRLALLFAREWERREQFDQALMLYDQTALPPSRERQARIALKLEQTEPALRQVTRMLQAPQDEQEATVGARLGKQLARQGHWHWSPLPAHKVRQQALTLSDNGERVELQVAQHYQAQGWQVFYCENSLLNGLLGLVIWPALFEPVPGAFLNPYQMGPRDLYRAQFAEHRRKRLDKELRHWRPKQLLARYRDKQGILNPLVQWDWFPIELAELALATLPRSLLDACFQRQLFDLRGNRSGHPDLFMAKESQARWLEVKGPGDRLQDNQTRWMRFLEDQGADVAVCQVKFE